MRKRAFWRCVAAPGAPPEPASFDARELGVALRMKSRPYESPGMMAAAVAAMLLEPRRGHLQERALVAEYRAAEGDGRWRPSWPHYDYRVTGSPWKSPYTAYHMHRTAARSRT
ncbi:MAG TPA: hypothetical protein VKB88_08370 [Bryobacteraceae bacterium]|nr:hypothetical protein [Bryobacteraceae bacterium]